VCIFSNDWKEPDKFYFALLRLVWVEKTTIMEAVRKGKDHGNNYPRTKRTSNRQGRQCSNAIREIRAKTRRKFLAEDEIRIVWEGFRKEMPIYDLCR
jgi:hypothetical protein